MPLFNKEKHNLNLIKPTKFSNEKELQNLIESNLEVIFNCKFVETEFSTGAEHGGRIDTLALSEDNSPVVIEYKITESSQLVNQSLYYLSWLNDHRGDFEITVQKAFPNENIEIDWSEIRVICIAPEYKKFDLHAVKMMGANIELWKYRFFENKTFLLEEIFQKSTIKSASISIDENKNPIMVEAGKKAAITRATGTYTLEEHFKKTDQKFQDIAKEIQEYTLSIDESIEEIPKKYYIAYKVSQNFVCMEINQRKILLYLKISPKTLDELPSIGRDVSNIGHYGTGNLEIRIKDLDDLKISKQYILMAFNNIGGN